MTTIDHTGLAAQTHAIGWSIGRRTSAIAWSAVFRRTWRRCNWQPAVPTSAETGVLGSADLDASGTGRSALLALTQIDGHSDITGDRNIDATLIGARWTRPSTVSR